ncbi:MAG: hypothetical protein O2971_20170, partial [Proteobacteria bacterium]|nr:hypothetical protein [Pseudomonadota bacterium]
NGRWLETYELPADRRRHGSFDILSDRSDQRVRTIIDDLTSIEPQPAPWKERSVTITSAT